MVQGKIRYIFNCGTGPAILESDQIYNDGLWHKIEFTRNQNEGLLNIDGQKVAEGKSNGSSKALNIVPPYYIGGVPDDITESVYASLVS